MPNQGQFSDADGKRLESEERRKKRALSLIEDGDAIAALDILRFLNPDEKDDVLAGAITTLLAKDQPKASIRNSIIKIFEAFNDPKKIPAEKVRDFCVKKGWSCVYLGLARVIGWDPDPEVLKTIRERKTKDPYIARVNELVATSASSQ